MRMPLRNPGSTTSFYFQPELPPVHSTVFAEGCLAYKLAYGKGLTPFLRLAQNAGVQRIADGVGLQVEQAAEAFAWWRGVRPDTRAMISQLTVPLLWRKSAASLSRTGFRTPRAASDWPGPGDSAHASAA